MRAVEVFQPVPVHIRMLKISQIEKKEILKVPSDNDVLLLSRTNIISDKTASFDK